MSKFHLLKFVYSVDDIYQHRGYVVLNDLDYQDFKQGTNGDVISYQMLGNGNNYNKDGNNCHLVEHVELEPEMGQRLSQLMNNFDLHKTVTRLINYYHHSQHIIRLSKDDRV